MSDDLIARALKENVQIITDPNGNVLSFTVFWKLQRQTRILVQSSKPATDVTKHIKANNIDDAISFSKTHAQYLPDLKKGNQHHILEKTAAWNAVNSGLFFKHGEGTTFFFHRFDDVVGYDGGQATRWVRVEITSGGATHGHPMSFERVKRQLRNVDIDISELYE